MKIAVVGTGSIGASHLEAISTSNSCTLCAVCDINEEAAKKYAEKYGVPYFTDYKQIPGKCGADAVILNLPHWLHCEVTEFFWTAVCMFWWKSPWLTRLRNADA